MAIPRELQELIIKDLQQGWNISQVSRQRNVSCVAIRKIRNAAEDGVLPRKQKRISDELQASILSDLHRRCSIVQISRKYGISGYIVRRIRDRGSLRHRDKELTRLPIKVPEFRCPLCGTLNILKAEYDDKLCLACIAGMRGK